ncbi:MAG: NADH-quinone oxidoreductase subunit N [Armatimonadetes bacterium CG_4_10_14_3_um_filter_66_18]|nr:NADH-quinone oxidoreductase subunit N [Armatimonadota bacterium]PIU93382.1 MAG: NADH-quinone oxidoreductase subunit N [Armatimonadetes bacterium CG06_land_8_20_14_3_00_66_21]PIX40089.1 MAG: NADH-quinone oxidoreductase subunit N [Armatimonadetes bacterium CG_4_8_14_3_um_filter_66_20]PIY40072.1 MAG: NADH-quinone oxidoreductase subunit N [Armatimonadetes bacterium CG_4_10_14_3_um_filter_66_18]PIZ37577.1 MAG: NADH-quinone oxidoreductase subunit N [Armatimonadetes bacterium CG_4_10_14_0_8_um_filt
MGGTVFYLMPEIVLALLGVGLIVLDTFTSRERKNWLGWLAFLGLFLAFELAACATAVWSLGPQGGSVHASVLPRWAAQTVTFDPFAGYFKLLVIAAAGLTVLLSLHFVHKHVRTGVGEFYAFIVFGTLGMTLMVSSTDLILLYLAIEFTSISSYVLAGYLRRTPQSAEAGIKYFLLGAVSSATMLYGMSLIYGFSGSTHIGEIAQKVQAGNGTAPIVVLGVGLMLAGFGFKIAAAPFHMWCPDVFEGAPTPVAALLSVGPKAAGMAVLIRVFHVFFGPQEVEWSLVIAVIATATMTIGNVVALVQTNIKRMLGYSTIAQVGYMLVGVAATGPEEWRIPGVLLYLLTYLFMNLGAFAVVITVSNAIESDEIADYSGLFRRAPVACLAFLVFALSLAGLPPMSGFVAKFMIFGAAIHSGLLWLALVGIANSVISVYYYFNVVRLMFFAKAAGVEEPLPEPGTLRLVTVLTAAATILIGVYPQPFIDLARGSLQMLAPF